MICVTKLLRCCWTKLWWTLHFEGHVCSDFAEIYNLSNLNGENYFPPKISFSSLSSNLDFLVWSFQIFMFLFCKKTPANFTIIPFPLLFTYLLRSELPNSVSLFCHIKDDDCVIFEILARSSRRHIYHSLMAQQL